MNGYGISNYNVTLKGWDHADCVVSLTGWEWRNFCA